MTTTDLQLCNEDSQAPATRPVLVKVARRALSIFAATRHPSGCVEWKDVVFLLNAPLCISTTTTQSFDDRRTTDERRDDL
jgi:hypothetical protein